MGKKDGAQLASPHVAYPKCDWFRVSRSTSHPISPPPLKLHRKQRSISSHWMDKCKRNPPVPPDRRERRALASHNPALCCMPPDATAIPFGPSATWGPRQNASVSRRPASDIMSSLPDPCMGRQWGDDKPIWGEGFSFTAVRIKHLGCSSSDVERFVASFSPRTRTRQHIPPGPFPI